MDGSGTKVVKYTYDAWGKLISTSGTLASTLGADNPFRYRGYYYDTETGLYYLMTRYYDPEVGRFLSADVYLSTGQGVLGGNMWAYCLNNPIIFADTSGTSVTVCVLGITFTVAEILVGTLLVVALVDVLINGTESLPAVVVSAVTDGAAIVAESISTVIPMPTHTGVVSRGSGITVASKDTDINQRSDKPIGRRKKYKTKKEAKEAAKKAGKGNEPIHHPNGSHGPHYHPNIKLPSKLTPKMPRPYDHYYYGGSGIRVRTK